MNRKEGRRQGAGFKRCKLNVKTNQQSEEDPEVDQGSESNQSRRGEGGKKQGSDAQQGQPFGSGKLHRQGSGQPMKEVTKSECASPNLLAVGRSGRANGE